MSSIICTPKHFYSIERALQEMILSKGLNIPYSLREICPKSYQLNPKDIKAITSEISTLIDTLSELNVICVNLQYRHKFKGKLNSQIQAEILHVKQRNCFKHLSKLGLYNALGCLSYQIEIEHLLELRPLEEREVKAMEFLKEITIALGQRIITELPEDTTNKWDI